MPRARVRLPHGGEFVGLVVDVADGGRLVVVDDKGRRTTVMMSWCEPVVMNESKLQVADAQQALATMGAWPATDDDD